MSGTRQAHAGDAALPPERREAGRRLSESRLFNASNRNILTRIVSAAIAAVGMTPFLPPIWIGLWCAAIIAVPFYGIRTAAAAAADPRLQSWLPTRLMLASLC